MAKITLSSKIKSIHGRTGNMVFYYHSEYEIQYARSYSIPRNPSTDAQQKNRSSFAEISRLWKGLPALEQSFYNRMAYGKKLSGYNIFISMRKKGITTEVLKLMNKLMRYSRYVYSSYMIRSTSVHGSAQEDNNCIHLQGSMEILKKPPGEMALAS